MQNESSCSDIYQLPLKEKVAGMCRIEKSDKAVISLRKEKIIMYCLSNMEMLVEGKENYIVPWNQYLY